MIEVQRETRMEKLELLSHTALLKQGIDRTSDNPSEGYNKINIEDVVFVDSKSRLATGVPVAPRSRHLLSTTANVPYAAIPRSKIGDGRRDTASPSTLSINTSTVVGSNLASPVSTDVEDEGDAGAVTTSSSIVSSKTRHNLHITKARIIESRSPITTVENTQYGAASLSSPFPSSPQSYGFGLLPSHGHILHRSLSQDLQEYPHSQFNNQNGNIIRTLSEASFTPVYGGSLMSQNTHNVAATATNNTESDAAFHPPTRDIQPPRLQLQQRRQSSAPSQEEMARQIRELREQLSEKDIVVSSLQQRVNYLENQIHELRQLPTGKISHIPVDDMIRIMQEYGSEVSNQTLPHQRKQSIKKASIVRQFRRWNPNFFRFFLHHNGEWVPKLGREGERRRRAEKRRLILIAKQGPSTKANGIK